MNDYMDCKRYRDSNVECIFTIAFQYKFNVTNISRNHIIRSDIECMLTITGLIYHIACH